MPRSLSAALQTQVSSTATKTAFLVELNLSTVIRLTDWYTNVTYDSNSYEAHLLLGVCYDELCKLREARYEIETAMRSANHRKKIQQYARKGLDIIIVFTPKLPNDEYERYKYLKDVIIVPD